MAADNVTEVYGSYDDGSGLLWHSTGGSSTPANGNNDLLAFRAGGTLYSTGVDDGALAAGFTPAVFRAFSPTPGMVPASGGLNAIPLADNYDAGKTRASYLSDGGNGLDLNTALFNIPRTQLAFDATVSNTGAISDAVPDILVTQVGQPSANVNDVFYFADASGNIVGTPVAIRLGGVPTVGRQMWQFWNPNHTPNTGLSGSRDLRMRAYHLSDFGITAANMGQVARFVQNLSGESDLSFIAYNQDALQMPAQLEVSKSNGRTQVAPNASTTYTVTIRNTGGAPATAVSWVDTVAGVTVNNIVSTSSTGAGNVPGSCSPTGCTGITVAAGGSITYTVTATVTGAAGTNAENTASITSNDCQSMPARCSSTDTDQIVSPPSVTVSKTNGVNEVEAGSTTVYTVLLTNNGTGDAAGLSWTDTAPQGLSISSIVAASVTAGSTAGTCDSQGCTGITILEGGSIGYAVTATVTGAESTNAVNTVTVDGGGGACVNGTSGISTAICSATDTDPIAPVVPALQITKGNGVDQLAPGSTATYTVVVTNRSNASVAGASWADTATGMTVTQITPPAGVPGAGTCDASGCSNITVPANGSLTYTVTAIVTAATGSSVMNRASLQGGGCTAGGSLPECSDLDSDPVVVPVAPPTSVPVDSRAMLALLGLLLAVAAARRVGTGK
jgi:uncharacterized repeat protein (TIGR01451 family)